MRKFLFAYMPVLAVLCLTFFVSQHAHAAVESVSMTSATELLSVAQGGGGGGGNDKAGCTSEFPKADNSDGLLTQIVDYVKEVIDQATQELFDGINNNQKFINAVNAAFALFVTLFGVMFIFGIVPLTLGQASTRLFKFAIILAILEVGFQFFDEYVITFFNDGTDALIDAVLGIATGDTTGMSRSADGSPQPFTKIEGIVSKAISPQMMVTVITSATTGPMGPAMGGLLGLGMMAFIHTLIKALKVYCLSLIAKALLFGLAPIFLTFMMFERTKHMFSGWTNQLVNYSLQPLLMFAFLSFYIILLESAADNILNADICWTEFQHMSGASNATALWRFKIDGQPGASNFTWEGAVSCIQKGGNCDDFPVSIIDILTFLILAHLAYRFADVVVMIATEISSSTLFLDKIRGGMGDYFKNMKGGDQKAAGNAIASATRPKSVPRG